MIKEIYICCHESDKAHERRLRDGLKPVLERFDLSLWSRSDLVPAQEWKKEIHNHLKNAAFFVPFVSPSLIASDDCYKEVLAAKYRAQRKELKIISIRLSPVAFFEYSELAEYPFLPDKTITEHPNTDKAWADTLHALIEMISTSHRYLK